MEKIIICEGISSSISYVYDIRQEGYEPVILETFSDDVSLPDKRNAIYNYIESPMPRVIRALPNYEDTLELVKKENPKLVVAGSEQGVEIATLLANDLNLRCNKKDFLTAAIDKHRMQMACKDAGIRYIHGKMVQTKEEAVEFFNKCKKGAVLKPTHNHGSCNVCVCATEEEISNGFDKIVGSQNLEGDVNTEVLIQERIVGPEYICNTVSRDSKSYVSSLYIYGKKRIPGAASIYDFFETITHDEVDDKIKAMMDYAIDVTRAVGVENGPMHGEFMIDEDGPVLIEVNCRICGGDLPRKFLDKIFGHHETNLCLDSYLYPEKFEERMKQKYFTPGKGYLKSLIVNEDIDIVDAPVCAISKKMPTFYSVKHIDEKCPMHLKKTIDFFTTGGKIFFASEDTEQVTKDCMEICRLEREEYEKMYTLA